MLFTQFFYSGSKSVGYEVATGREEFCLLELLCGFWVYLRAEVLAQDVFVAAQIGLYIFCGAFCRDTVEGYLFPFKHMQPHVCSTYIACKAQQAGVVNGRYSGGCLCTLHAAG